MRKGRAEHTPVAKAEPVWIHAACRQWNHLCKNNNNRLQSMAVTQKFADGIRSKVTFVNMRQTSKFQMWTKSPMNNIQHTTDIWAYINWSYLFFTFETLHILKEKQVQKSPVKEGTSQFHSLQDMKVSWLAIFIGSSGDCLVCASMLAFFHLGYNKKPSALLKRQINITHFFFFYEKSISPIDLWPLVI